MPNIAAVLKEEIRRLARREVKAHTSSTKGAVAQYRRDIAQLKRQMQAQAKEIAFLKAQEHKRLGQPEVKGKEELEGVRFSARSVKAQRRKLKLSAADYGKARRRVGPDHLQLGARQGTSPTKTVSGPGGSSGAGSACGAGKAGAVAGPRHAGQHVVPGARAQRRERVKDLALPFIAAIQAHFRLAPRNAFGALRKRGCPAAA